MSSSTVTYLLLDADYDPVFDPQVSLTDVAAVQQNILTALRLFEGEWWEDLNLGLPLFQSILGALGSQRGQAAINTAIIARIRQVPYVLNVLKVASAFVNGVFSFTATVQTSFGTVVVSTAPASSASLT